jgi:hypothetical protein
MPDEPNDPKDLRFNFSLVLKETRRWPFATAICLTILGALIAVNAISERPQDAIYVLINVVGFLSGAFGLKALGHLMTYAMSYKKPFPGSFLVATGIAMIPVFAFYACGFFTLAIQNKLGVQEGDKFSPLVGFLILFAIGYPLFTVFFAGFFRAQQWIQLNRAKL